MSRHQSPVPLGACAFLSLKCSSRSHQIPPTHFLLGAQVLAELKEYATEVDVDFVRKAVRAIGRCAIKVEVSRFWDAVPSQGGRRLLKKKASLVLAAVCGPVSPRVTNRASKVPTMQTRLVFLSLGPWL